MTEPDGLGDDRPGLLDPNVDLFYHGSIVELRHGREEGAVRTGNGRTVPFEAAFVEFLGCRGLRDLREGMTVMFDLGWTSRGLRVTKIRPG